MGRVNCHTHAAKPADATSIIAAFVLDPAFTNHIALRATPAQRAGLGPCPEPQPYSAPRYIRQPTLARGCEAEPAEKYQTASAKRRGDQRMDTTLPMVRKGEIFIHDGETCA